MGILFSIYVVFTNNTKNKFRTSHLNPKWLSKKWNRQTCFFIYYYESMYLQK